MGGGFPGGFATRTPILWPFFAQAARRNPNLRQWGEAMGMFNPEVSLARALAAATQSPLMAAIMSHAANQNLLGAVSPADMVLANLLQAAGEALPPGFARTMPVPVNPTPFLPTPQPLPPLPSPDSGLSPILRLRPPELNGPEGTLDSGGSGGGATGGGTTGSGSIQSGGGLSGLSGASSDTGWDWDAGVWPFI